MNKIKNILGKSFKVVAFLIFTLIWSLFVYAIEGEWLYFIPIIISDILFFETISWQFWKKKKAKKTKKKSEIRSWVEAITFAVIAATLLRTFLIEAYTIPTSSMEKSMLIGDFLFVSKTSYGPRVPMTPLAFPLVHHTLPFTKNTKSYSEAIKLAYHRMKGFGDVKRNDCVVFNWPAEKLGRPIDKKENYVKRCVGIPNDTIEVIDGILYVNNQVHLEPNGMKKQYLYNIKTKSSGLNPKILYEKFDITEGRRGKNPNEYILQLTDTTKLELLKFNNVVTIDREINKSNSHYDYIFPNEINFKWNIDNFGKIIIPKEGVTVKLNSKNLPIYRDIIERYETNDLVINNDSIYINNILSNEYTFKMNYYWMMGDNRHNSADSRMWGFVPENHIVGKALFVWMSWDTNAKGLKKVRWNRLFTSVK
jgi:signal peptidase I